MMIDGSMYLASPFYRHWKMPTNLQSTCTHQWTITIPPKIYYMLILTTADLQWRICGHQTYNVLTYM